MSKYDDKYIYALEDALLLLVADSDSECFRDPTHGAVLERAWQRAARRRDSTPCPLDQWFDERQGEFSTRLRNVFEWYIVPQTDVENRSPGHRGLELPVGSTIVDLACVQMTHVIRAAPNMGVLTARELEAHLKADGLTFGMNREDALVAYRPREFKKP